MATLAANSVEGRARTFIERIENLYDEMASLKGDYMTACKQRREDIKEILVEAKEKGVPARALRGVLKYRDLERRQAEIKSGIEDVDEAAALDALISAYGTLGEVFGDTPMGSYAHQRAEELKGLNGE